MLKNPWALGTFLHVNQMKMYTWDKIVNFPQLLFAALFPLNNGLFQKKSTPTRQKARKGGLMALEIQTGGGSEPKNTSLGVTFNFTGVSIALRF